MSIVFLLVILTLIIVLKVLKVPFIEPAPLFIYSWLTPIVFIQIGCIQYDSAFNSTSFASLIACIVAYVLGALFVRSCSKYSDEQSLAKPLMAPPRWLLMLMAFSALLYFGVQLKELRNVLSTLGGGSGGLGELREAHWDGYSEGSVDGLHGGMTILRTNAILIAMAFPIFRHYRMTRLLVTSCLAVAGIFIETASHGGRGLVVQVLVGAAYCHFFVLAITGKKLRSFSDLVRALGPTKSIMYGVAGLFAFYFLFAVFPAMRNPDAVSRLDRYLGFTVDARIAPWVYDFADNTGLDSLPILVYGSSYLSKPIPAYSFFTSSSDIGEWYLMGGYNISTIDKIRSLVTGEPTQFTAVRENIAAIRAAHHLTPNPWATGVRDFVIDFGYIGSAFALFCFGGFCQWVYIRARRTAKLEWIVAACIVAVFSLGFAFMSLLVPGSLRNAIFAALLLVPVSIVIRGMQKSHSYPRRAYSTQNNRRRLGPTHRHAMNGRRPRVLRPTNGPTARPKAGLRPTSAIRSTAASDNE